MEQHLHFIGVGGIGMSAIARIMLHQGFSISGSDVQHSHLTEELSELGARISIGHAAANLPPDTQAVVYSSAVKPDNPELIEASRRGLRIYRRAEMLAFLMTQKQGVGVAGAHGKTTCSAMIATMLEAEGQDPTIIIGGRLPYIGNSNAKAGDGPTLVAEADESDGTFLLLHPKVAVVTNIEADHLDYYHDLEHIVAAFRTYLAQVPADGFAVVGYDCAISRQLAEQAPCRHISFALHTAADYTAEDIRHHSAAEGGGVQAQVLFRGQPLGLLRLRVSGEHNVANALAAVAVGRELGLSFEQCAAGLACFTGTGRRFESLGCDGALRVFDDYAHHPTEIAATISSARAQGAKNLCVVFQPHRYSRTQAMYKEFAAALMAGDRVLILELYPAFEQPIFGVTAELVSNAMRELGHAHVVYAPDIDTAVAQLEQLTQGADMLLIMGAGNVRSVGEQFMAQRGGHS